MTPSSRRSALLTGLAALLLCVTQCAVAQAAGEVTVFAAASLGDVLQQLADQYTRATGVLVRSSFAASSALARQIEAGARADVFISADPEWMDYLQQRALLRTGSRHDLLGNRLVLVAPADSRVVLRIGPNFPLRATLGTQRLSTGDPDMVPAGRYARAALVTLGVWNAVADRLVRAENVRAALAFVARGEAPLGIVYSTDALADRRVRIVDTFPATSHPAITYPIALSRDSSAAAAGFVDYLRGAAGRAAFQRHGFSVLP